MGFELTLARHPPIPSGETHYIHGTL